MNKTAIALMTTALVLLNGYLACFHVLTTNNYSLYNMKEIASTPLATMLIIVGLLGIAMIKDFNNIQTEKLKQRRFYLGFSYIFVSFIGLELLVYFIQN